MNEAAVRLPRLVLLPGLHGTDHAFAPLLHALPDKILTTVISYPGDQRLSYEDLLSFIRARLPVDEPFVLLGESFSGPLAIRIAVEKPVGLRGVILAATFVRKPVWWLPGWIGPLLPAWPFRVFPLWVQLRVLTSGRSSPELQRHFRIALSGVKPQVLAHRVAEVLKVDVVREFQRIQIPLLVLAGRYDRTVPGRNLKLLRQLRSDLQVEMIDSDHLVLQTEPQRAAGAIQRFVLSVCET